MVEEWSRVAFAGGRGIREHVREHQRDDVKEAQPANIRSGGTTADPCVNAREKASERRLRQTRGSGLGSGREVQQQGLDRDCRVGPEERRAAFFWQGGPGKKGGGVVLGREPRLTKLVVQVALVRVT